MIMALRNERGRKLISCREAAEAYGCTMSYIRRLARLGRLETEEVGGSYVFDEAEVRKLASQAAKGEGRQRKRAGGFKPG
jgi:excisionase family DNA binding protein